MRPKKPREVAIHARYVNYIADFKPEKHLSPFRWKYIFIFCKLNHSFTLAKPSVSWGSFCNDLHWKREHLQIICSKKKKKYFLSKRLLHFLSSEDSHSLSRTQDGALSRLLLSLLLGKCGVSSGSSWSWEPKG